MDRYTLLDMGGGTASGLLSARAAAAPHNLALLFEDEQYTYEALDRRVAAVGAGLVASGFKQGEAISIFMSNRPEYLFAWWGSCKAGMVHVPVNTEYKGTFLHYAIAHSESCVIFTESRLHDALVALEDMPARVRLIVYADEVPPKAARGGIETITLNDLVARGTPDIVFPGLQYHDIACISFTSGTTGRSKGVVSPHLQGVVMGMEAANAFTVTARDRMYSCMPLFHGMAQMTTCLAALHAGATIALAPRFSVSRIWDDLRKHRATIFNSLGSLLHMLLSAPPSPKDRDHCVTRVFAAPAPASVLYRFEQRFGVHVIEGYGQTEIKNVLYNPMHGRRVGSMGKPTPSSVVEVHDDHGREVPHGQVGELVYRPRMANIMLRGYHGDLAATVEGMTDMWWHTGDLASRDADGFFYYVDRKKDSLRRLGENISSQELEGAIAEFPGIDEVAVVAIDTEHKDIELLAVFETTEPDGFNYRLLFDHCVKTVPRYMVPRYYRAVRTLPRTPTGKVRKVDLRQGGLADQTWDYVALNLSVPRK